MTRAAVSLLALCALCVPTVLLAQDEAFKPKAAEALRGFGALFRGKCYPALSRQLRIAVAEMKPSPTLTDTVRTIATKGIEGLLENDPVLVVVPKRLNAELTVAWQELQAYRALAPDTQLDGIVTIETAGADPNRKPTVKVTAYARPGGDECQRTALSDIPVGDIKAPFADPDAFFKDAAQKLPGKNIERLLVMQPDVGIGIGASSSGTVQLWREKLAAEIRETLTRRKLLTGDIPHVGLVFVDRMPLSGTWQAKVNLRRLTEGISIGVRFIDPEGLPAADASGFFAPELLAPALSDKQALEVRPAKPRFKIGDLLDVRIRVRQPSRLFCFDLDPADGEAATLIYPTTESLNDHANLFGPQDEEIQFTGATDGDHDKFKVGVKIELKKPVHEFFYCIAVPQPPPDRLTALWLENTLRARLQRTRPLPALVDPDRAREILSGLRQIDGAAEAFAEIVSE